jgi:zinc/manganese transport system ATP-binding protein
MTELAREHGVPGRGGSGTAAVRLVDGEVWVGGHVVWRDVSVTVEQGQFAAVLGPNGSGKSTLIKAILGLVPLRSGELTVLGRPAGRANDEIGYLPQRRSFDAGLPVRGIDLVRLGVDGGRWGLPLPWPRTRRRSDERARVDEMIELVGAASYARRPIGQLSGGEQQRLLIAQALVQRPRLLLLDEPLDSLDLPNQASVASLVADICRTGVAVMLVAHDVNPILPYLDRVVYLGHGGAVEGTPQQAITGDRLSDLYGTPIEVLRTSDGRLVVVGQPEAPAHHHDRHP